MLLHFHITSLFLEHVFTKRSNSFKVIRNSFSINVMLVLFTIQHIKINLHKNQAHTYSTSASLYSLVDSYNQINTHHKSNRNRIWAIWKSNDVNNRKKIKFWENKSFRRYSKTFASTCYCGTLISTTILFSLRYIIYVLYNKISPSQSRRKVLNLQLSEKLIIIQ